MFICKNCKSKDKFEILNELKGKTKYITSFTAAMQDFRNLLNFRIFPTIRFMHPRWMDAHTKFPQKKEGVIHTLSWNSKISDAVRLGRGNNTTSRAASFATLSSA